VLYVDYQGINWGSPQTTLTSAVSSGFNVVIISFLLLSGATDMALAWQGVDQQTQQQTMQTVHQQGGVVLVSAGGSSEIPYGQIDGWSYGQKAAQWATQNNLDGVDFDMENFGPPLIAGGLNPQETIDWLINASNAASEVLGEEGIITHAPQAPYFGKIGGGGGNTWTGTTGGYTAVWKGTSSISWFNLQFYNQGVTCYVDYTGLFEESGEDCQAFPGTSVKEIQGYGIPFDAIVVGKPVGTSNAASGWVSASDLNEWFTQANSLGWNTGVMGWEWYSPQVTGSWIQTIYP